MEHIDTSTVRTLFSNLTDVFERAQKDGQLLIRSYDSYNQLQRDLTEYNKQLQVLDMKKGAFEMLKSEQKTKNGALQLRYATVLEEVHKAEDGLKALGELEKHRESVRAMHVNRARTSHHYNLHNLHNTNVVDTFTQIDARIRNIRTVYDQKKREYDEIEEEKRRLNIGLSVTQKKYAECLETIRHYTAVIKDKNKQVDELYETVYQTKIRLEDSRSTLIHVLMRTEFK